MNRAYQGMILNAEQKSCRYSNLVLTDEKRRIVACARQISGKMSSLRSLQTGAEYAPPPPQEGADPSADESLEDWVSCLRASGTYQIAGAMCRSYRVCVFSSPSLCPHHKHSSFFIHCAESYDQCGVQLKLRS